MVSAVVFDLDGVVYRGSRQIPGVAREIARLQGKMPVLFLTNNATKSRLDYVRHLAAYGIKARVSDVMTSSFGCACYISEKYGKGQRVHVVGEQGLKDELEMEAGARLVNKGADFVVAGLDRQFCYEKLDLALDNIHNGAKFILANSDPTWPRERGFAPGSGAIGAAISYAAGRKPDVVIGKPSTYLIRKLLQMHRIRAKDAAFVGDRLEIDIRMANRVGMKSVLVLTGVARRNDVKRAQKGDRPSAIAESAASLGKALGI